MLAERDHVLVLDQVACRLGDDQLSAVRDGRNSRSTMDVHPHVSLVREQRLASVQADAHAQRHVQDRVVGSTGGSDRSASRLERDEERVALRIDLDAAVPLPHTTQRNAMDIQRQRVVRSPEPAQQRGRTFDVREQEGHGSSWP